VFSTVQNFNGHPTPGGSFQIVSNGTQFKSFKDFKFTIEKTVGPKVDKTSITPPWDMGRASVFLGVRHGPFFFLLNDLIISYYWSEIIPNLSSLHPYLYHVYCC